MAAAPDLLQTLRTWGRLSAGEVVQRLGISRPTLMRAVRSLGPDIISRGAARRTAYAARRAVRGNTAAIPLYTLDAEGRAHETAILHPTHPEGCAMELREDLAWPLMPAMQDGWFDGLPYFLDDMRPQGFMGRHFARAHAALLQVPEDPRAWSEDDVLHALSIAGSDLPGCHVLGETALRQWLGQAHEPLQAIGDKDIAKAYPALASTAMTVGVAGSCAGGEFPKFTAVRSMRGEPQHVLVKFSGSDDSPGTRRWADLLVCEHLAGLTVAERLGLPAATSTIHRAGGRTFLEVQRFDRVGARGRAPVCSWHALNGGLIGLGDRSWAAAADALQGRGHTDPATREQIHVLWHFGRLIANTDMHDGNLSFLPGLRLAPVYDMLPMLYAPERGVELPARAFAPALPIPSERPAWERARDAAQSFWDCASADRRISAEFRAICEQNASRLQGL